MRRILVSGCLIVCIAVFSTVQSQQAVQSQYRFKHITVDEGLSNNRVKSICQDSKGFIWIATQNGADKFNGQSIKAYRHDPNDSTTISSNSVSTIFLDSKNNLWIGNAGGLDRYDEELDKFIRFTHKDIKWPIGAVEQIVEDKQGKLWFGAGSGLYSLDLSNAKLQFFSNAENNSYSIPSDQILRVLVDSENKVWFAISNNGLAVYDQDQQFFKFFRNIPDDPTSISDNQIERLYEDSEGTVWAGSLNNGLNQYIPATASFDRTIPDSENSYSTRVRAIFEDGNGDFFVGTRGGLYIRNRQTGSFELYAFEGHNFSDLSQNSILCSFIDKTGTLWIGTFSGGVNYTDLNRKEFIHYRAGKDDNHFLNGSNIYTITEDRYGNLWIGGDNGLNFLDRSTHTFTYYVNDPDDPHSLSYNDIKALEWDKNNNLWIGTNNGGLDYYNAETGQFKSFRHDPDDPNSIHGNKIYGLLNDKFNNLWIIANRIASDNELSIDFLPNGSDKFIHLNEKAHYGFEEDEAGNVFIGGVNGFWIFMRSDSVFNFISNEKLISSVNTVRLDSEGKLWIGSSKGLVRYDIDKSSFVSFTEENGYPISEVFGILEDEEKSLWLSTNFGLVKMINIVEDITNVSYKVYDSEDGLQSKQFNYNAYHKGQSGEMAFGGINGFNTFYPKKIVDNPQAPGVVITDLRIFNESAVIGEKIRGRLILEKSISETARIVLGRKQNVFALEFAALHYANPEKNTFKFMLEGFDDDWQYRKAGSNIATYSNLRAGEYTFLVSAANNDGIWNEEPAQIVIVVKPPFWKTWWFYTLVVLMIIGVSFLVMRIRERELKADREKLENELKHGKAEIEKQQEEIQKQQEAIRIKEEEETKIKWHNEGIAKFSELISANKDNVEKLSQVVLSNLVSYVEADQGGIFILNDDELAYEERVLERVASYAYSGEKFKKKSFLPDEGLIGNCFTNREIERIDNLPEDYTDLSSGLGKSSPKHLLLVPIRLADFVIGVLELASFKKIEDHKLEFILKITENITSVISIVRRTEQAEQAVSIANEQKEEILAQEEELRQNMEEMQATQDELLRKQEEFANETAMLETLLNFLQDRITIKDTEGVYLRVNKIKSDALKLNDSKDAIGLTDAEFFGDEHFQKALADEKKLLKSGKAILNSEEQLKFKDGRVQWGSTSRIPFRNAKGDLVGTLIITKNISEEKLLSGKLESQDALLKDLTSSQPLICYEATHTGIVSSIYGHGLDLLDKSAEEAEDARLFSVFKELKFHLDFEKLEDHVTAEYKTKSKGRKYRVEHSIFKNASTGGILGVAQVTEV